MTDVDTAQIVLIVDDEEMVLTSLNTFLMLETDYEVVTFSSAKEALEYIQINRIDLVISDFLMPEMDGISFLARVRELRPGATRILLTGYADKENAIKAINEVELFQYIEKPWDNDKLLLVLRDGLEQQQLMKELERKLADTQKAHADLQKGSDEEQQQLMRALEQKIAHINETYADLQRIQERILKPF